MIFDAVLLVLSTLIAGIVHLISEGVPSPPSWVASGFASLNAVTAYASGLGAWVPWATVISVLLSLLTLAAAIAVVRLIRLVASFLTGGGGAM